MKYTLSELRCCILVAHALLRAVSALLPRLLPRSVENVSPHDVPEYETEFMKGRSKPSVGKSADAARRTACATKRATIIAIAPASAALYFPFEPACIASSSRRC